MQPVASSYTDYRSGQSKTSIVWIKQQRIFETVKALFRALEYIISMAYCFKVRLHIHLQGRKYASTLQVDAKRSDLGIGLDSLFKKRKTAQGTYDCLE
jgi:hypothetical protein